MGQSCCCLASGAIYDRGAPLAAKSHTAHIDGMKAKRLVINSEAKRSRGWNMDIGYRKYPFELSNNPTFSFI